MSNTRETELKEGYCIFYLRDGDTKDLHAGIVKEVGKRSAVISSTDPSSWHVPEEETIPLQDISLPTQTDRLIERLK